MTKLLFLRVYACYYCDYTKKLVNENTGEVLLEGDSYHDKINKQIEGFIKGLRHAGVFVSLSEEKEEKCDDCKELCNMGEYVEEG